MDLFVKYFFDVAIVFIILYGIFYGYKRGILRMVIAIIGIIVAAITANFIAEISYKYVYDTLVKDYVTEIIEEKYDEILMEYDPKTEISEMLSKKDIIPNFSGGEIEYFDKNDENLSFDLTNDEIRDTLNNVYIEYFEVITKCLSNVFPDEIIENAENYLKEQEETNDDYEVIYGDKTGIIATIEKNIIRPTMYVIVKQAISLAVFILVNFIFSLIARLISVLRKIPLVKSSDSFLGGILGLINGIVSVAVLIFITEIVIDITSNSNICINTQTTENSFLYGVSYDLIFYIIERFSFLG